MIKFYNSQNKYNNKINFNKGFTLVELIIAISIMAVLLAICIPMYNSYLHKARVAADWANLKSYYDEIQADFAASGEYNPNVPTDLNNYDNWKKTEIDFLDGQTAKMKDGYYAVTKDASGNGYQISYYCNKCLDDWDKHSKTCILILGT